MSRLTPGGGKRTVADNYRGKIVLIGATGQHQVRALRDLPGGPGEAQDGLPGRCNRPTDGALVDAAGNWVVGSKALGHNPTGINQGGQESLTPYSNFDFFLPYAGGRAGHTGDYLFRDQGSFGNTNGLWGILRVE